MSGDDILGSLQAVEVVKLVEWSRVRDMCIYDVFLEHLACFVNEKHPLYCIWDNISKSSR